MTSGIINTTNTNLLSLGTATAAGTLSRYANATNMVREPFARTIANASNANLDYLLLFGKVAYTSLGCTCYYRSYCDESETFDSNTGTLS